MLRCDGLVAEVADWAAGLEEVHRRIAGAFARAEPRARVLAYLRGLLGQLERKKGSRSAGVARQYTGTTGKIDNCQIGVFLGYATSAGRALIDRELYLPKAWTDDRERARAAGIGDAVGFATKPELARRMLTRALEDGVPAGWLTADELYGQDKRLRVWCEQHGLPYV